MNRRDLLKSLAGVSALPLVKDAEILRADPDDVIVLKLATPVSSENAARIAEVWRRAVPSHQNVVVVDTGVDISVIRSTKK